MAALTYTTERLSVHDWTPHLGDEGRRSLLAARLTEILTPAVLAQLPEPLHLESPDQVPAWIDARAAESDVHLITTRRSGDIVGLLILAQFDGSPPDVHIGYLLAEETWGQGLATEMLSGLIDTLPRPARLLAGVKADNPASARVLEKVGFTRVDGDALYTRTLA